MPKTEQDPGQITRAEVRSQPGVWRNVLARSQEWDFSKLDSVDAYDEVLFLGSGTSYYLAMAAADWVARRSETPAVALPSGELLLDSDKWIGRAGKRRLVLAISRSGESTELLMAVKRLRGTNCRIIGVTCSPDSALVRLCDTSILLAEAMEDSLVMSRSFTSMLLALEWLFGDEADRNALLRIPDMGEAMFSSEVATIVQEIAARRHSRFVFLGSGPDYPIALESGLKMQEMAITTTEAYHVFEYRHGPKATADDRTLVVLFAPSDENFTRELIKDVASLGATTLVIGKYASLYDGIGDFTVPTDNQLTREQGRILNLLVAQQLAFEVALANARDPDVSHNLSKVVVF